jgi:AcrR family transcriptional regulator
MPADETQYPAGAAHGTLTRGFERGTATRAGLLAAAREVFTSVGYTEAGVTGIVALAGASVGSLHHHFVIGRLDITSRG